MEFLKDWQDLLIEDINSAGLRFSSNLSKETLIIRYFSYIRKIGPKKPLKVFKSEEFTCPEQYQNALSTIEELLKTGGDISPYLSKDVEKLKNDLMFNDWGVLHLHLGNSLQENTKYIERTGPLLFIYRRGVNVYLINIYPHQQWTNKGVVESLYNNWPELISPYILPGVTGMSQEYTEEEHLQLRKAGINVCMEIQDRNHKKIYLAPPGLGIATSGDSIEDVRNYQNIANRLMRLEDNITENIEEIKEKMIEEKKDLPNIYQFKIIKNDDKLEIREKNTGFQLRVNN